MLLLLPFELFFSLTTARGLIVRGRDGGIGGRGTGAKKLPFSTDTAGGNEGGVEDLGRFSSLHKGEWSSVSGDDFPKMLSCVDSIISDGVSVVLLLSMDD